MTPSGNEHATFSLVAQCLNLSRHYVPPYFPEWDEITRRATVLRNTEQDM